MKTIINLKKESRSAWFPYNLVIKSIVFGALILAGAQSSLQAQVIADQYTRPSWWFGAAAGANFNFYRGTTQELTSNLTVPTAFRHGKGLGLYVAPLIEFHRPESRWGAMLQAGYDNRSGKFDQVITPCDCPADLSATLSYLTVEPSLRFAPFKSDFYLYGGPRIAYNLAHSFNYEQGINPAVPDQVAPDDVYANFSNVEKMQISLQIGAGYDILLSSKYKKTQWVLSPFVAFHPYIGQFPRSIETWNVNTLRVGAAVKLGRGKKIDVPAAAVVVPDSEVQFLVNSPENIPVERRVRETFPILNYVFFDLGSTQIPDRYVMLNRNQVKDFKEDQLEVFTPKTLPGRSGRQMTAYYNLLNILGDRMGKNPSTNITLVGSSEKGPEDAKVLAQAVKTYLVDVFSINGSRITTEGRHKPKIPSEQPGGTLELDLLRQGDRRVSIESSSPALLMEFQSGPDAPLKPVEIIAVQAAPLDSYVTFNVAGADEAFTSWSLEVKDENGTVQNFGPYTQESVSIPGKAILGTRPEGDFKVAMIGTTKSGKTVKTETNVHMVLWVPDQDEEGMRFSVVFGFGDSKSIAMYDKYLTDIVAPKIPKNGTVIIHGYTDIIGDKNNNEELSIARANDVKSILEKSLAKANRKDVTFRVYGFGENENLAQYENTFPEERFYNRSVVIDVIPKD